MTDQVTNTNATPEETAPKADNQNTIFGEGTPAAPETTPAPQAPQMTLPEELQEYVGEGKKYSSIEDALRSIPHAQTHISKLEQENAEYKSKVEKAMTMEELIEQMRTQQPKEDNTSQQVGVGAEDLLANLSGQLEQMVEQKMLLDKQQEAYRANQGKVAKAFQETYGDKAEEMYGKLAEEVGMDVASLNGLAASSPASVLKMAQLGAKPKPAPSQQSSVNTGAFIANSASQPAERKTVMFGATSADILDSWRASRPQQ